MRPVSITQLRATATVDLMTAARALGLGRTKAYELAKHDQFPCRVIRIGEVYRIPTPGLLELLGVTAEEPRAPAMAAQFPHPVTATSPSRGPAAARNPARPGLDPGRRSPLHTRPLKSQEA